MDKEAHAAYMREWYQKNKDKVKGWTRRWQESNPDAKRAIDKKKSDKWRAKNPDASKDGQAKRRDAIRALKASAKSAGCPCGETDPKKLQFHHRDPSTKSFNIGDGAGHHGIQRVLEELAKCDVLCTKCHRDQHRG